MSTRSGAIRVLWFVNSSFPAVDRHLGKSEYVGTGWWMKTMLAEIDKHDNLKIGIAWASDGITEYQTFAEAGIVYYLVPLHPLPARRKNKINRVRSHLKRLFNLVYRHKYDTELKHCAQAVEEFKPDLVHVWGTENFYGLISSQVDVPVLVKFQGLLSVIKDDYWGALRWRDRIRMPNEMLAYIDIRNKARNEIVILKQNRYFEGRTFWDYSHLREHNTSACYFDIPEMMRPAFYEAAWSIQNIKKHSLYITARSMPLKGTACLVKAVSIIRQYVPDVQLRIGGHAHSEYGRFLKKMVSEAGLGDSVTFLGPLSEREIIDELLAAHVYILCSYIENSCNSLIEAQMVGVPCVAAYVGGVTSLVSDNETGMFFHKGDSATLAMTIQNIFNDDMLVLKLSRGARAFALNRHAPERIVEKTLSVYGEIVRANESSRNN